MEDFAILYSLLMAFDELLWDEQRREDLQYIMTSRHDSLLTAYLMEVLPTEFTLQEKLTSINEGYQFITVATEAFLSLSATACKTKVNTQLFKKLSRFNLAPNAPWRSQFYRDDFIAYADYYSKPVGSLPLPFHQMLMVSYVFARLAEGLPEVRAKKFDVAGMSVALLLKAEFN